MPVGRISSSVYLRNIIDLKIRRNIRKIDIIRPIFLVYRNFAALRGELNESNN